jgi:hypothetical protein
VLEEGTFRGIFDGVRPVSIRIQSRFVFNSFWVFMDHLFLPVAVE